MLKNMPQWERTTILCLSLMTVCMSAMILPSGYHLKGATELQRCRWACANQPELAAKCMCGVHHSLAKRSLSPPYTNDPESEIGLLIETLLGLRDKIQFQQEKEESSRYATNTQDNEEDGYFKLSVPKTEYTGSKDKSPQDENEAINMARSKKRWLSLHDEFDSARAGPNDVITDLWNDDTARRKAFRYG